MSRWKRELDRLSMPSDEADDPTGLGNGSDGSEEGSPSGTTIEGQDPPTPSEPQTPFKNPSLAGRFKTEEELAEFLSVQDSALKATRQRAEALESNTNRPAPEPEEEEDGDPKSFFERPHDEFKKIIQKELKAAIQPLLQDLATNRHRDAWNTVKSKYPNFETYREAVEETLKSWNIPPEQQSAELIERVFKSEVGNAVLSGGYNPPDPTSPRGENGDLPAGARVSPQHRPSSQPIRQPEDSKPKVKLTEEERKLARIQFKGSDKPEEEYIKWALDETKDQIFVLEEK